MSRNRGALTLVFAVLVVAAGLGVACGGEAEPAVYTEADSGQAVTVALGDTVTIRLVENPSTGYSWTAECSAGLERQSDRFIAPSTSPGVVGAAGTREYVFRAASAGAQQVKAVYARPWEKADDQGRKEFSLTIEVRER